MYLGSGCYLFVFVSVSEGFGMIFGFSGVFFCFAIRLFLSSLYGRIVFGRGKKASVFLGGTKIINTFGLPCANREGVLYPSGAAGLGRAVARNRAPRKGERSGRTYRTVPGAERMAGDVYCTDERWEDEEKQAN